MSETIEVGHIVVRSVLMPLQDVTLILPNAAVSEVISYEAAEQFSLDEQSWLLGTQVWRQQIVPLISFERLLDMPFNPEGKRLMVAVCNTLNGNPRRPYIGLVLSDIPHLIRANLAMIDSVISGPDTKGLTRGKMKIKGDELIIPDLDGLETRINAMLD